MTGGRLLRKMIPILSSSTQYYQQIVRALGSSLVGYWPLWEPSGATARDYSGNGRNAAYNGTYTLNQTGIGDGKASTLFVAGVTSGVNVAAAAAAYNLAEGAVAFWMAAGVAGLYADAGAYYTCTLSTDFTNGIIGRKFGANALTFYRRAGGALPTATIDPPTTARWVHLTFVWSVAAAKVWAYVNGTKIVPVSGVLNALAGPTHAAASMFGANSTAAVNGWAGRMAHCLAISGVPTDAQIWAISRAKRSVCFEGDSRSSQKLWPAAAMESAFPAGGVCFGGRGVGNWAVTGSGTAAMIARAAANVDTQIHPGATNTIVVWCGVNDALGLTAQQIYDNLHAYCEARRAAGWNRVIVCGEIDAVTAGWNAKYQALNVLLAADHHFADGYAALGDNVNLQDHTDVVYFNGDGVHLTAAGYAEVAAVVAPVLAAIA